MTTSNEADWRQRLSRHVRTRRQELGLSQQEVADRGGPSAATLYKIEAGVATSMQRGTKERLDIILGWTMGSTDMIMRGGDPHAEVEAVRRVNQGAEPGSASAPVAAPAALTERPSYLATLAEMTSYSRRALDLSVEDVAAAGGPAPDVLYAIEQGEPVALSPEQKRGLEQVLDWQPNWIDMLAQLQAINDVPQEYLDEWLRGRAVAGKQRRRQQQLREARNQVAGSSPGLVIPRGQQLLQPEKLGNVEQVRGAIAVLDQLYQESADQLIVVEDHRTQAVHQLARVEDQLSDLVDWREQLVEHLRSLADRLNELEGATT